jgi:hypothetical protein
MRNTIFIVAGLSIGLVASFYYISHSLSSLSAEPPPLTIEHLLTLTTYEQLQEVREAKVTELATILQAITDGQSAREHLPAAQQSFMQLGMIDTRIRMFPSHTEDELKSRSLITEPMAKLHTECERLGKSPVTRHELRSILIPLSPFQFVKASPPSLTNPQPAPKPATVLSHP